MCGKLFKTYDIFKRRLYTQHSSTQNVGRVQCAVDRLLRHSPQPTSTDTDGTLTGCSLDVRTDRNKDIHKISTAYTYIVILPKRPYYGPRGYSVTCFSNNISQLVCMLESSGSVQTAGDSGEYIEPDDDAEQVKLSSPPYKFAIIIIV